MVNGEWQKSSLYHSPFAIHHSLKRRPGENRAGRSEAVIEPALTGGRPNLSVKAAASGNSLAMRDCTGGGVGLPFLRRWLNHRKSVANRAEPTPSAWRDTNTAGERLSEKNA